MPRLLLIFLSIYLISKNLYNRPMSFLWFKAIHLIGLFAWFAGLFYLPRLFVYQAQNPALQSTFCIMQKKLYFYIMIPAMIISLVSGFLMVMQVPVYATALWLKLKLIGVLLIIIFHIICGYYVRSSLLERPLPSARFFKIFNEIPTVVLIFIVILVVFKYS